MKYLFKFLALLVLASLVSAVGTACGVAFLALTNDGQMSAAALFIASFAAVGFQTALGLFIEDNLCCVDRGHV